MKKITLLLMAALLIPMAMNAETKVYGQMNKKADKVVVSTTPTAVKATKSVKFNAVPKADVPEGYASVTLTAGDVWQDGRRSTCTNKFFISNIISKSNT